MLFIFVDHVYLLLFVVEASLGTSVNLNCSLRNSGHSYVYWLKRDHSNNFQSFAFNTTKYVGRNAITLTIHNLVYDDTGIYRCEGYVNRHYTYGQEIKINVTGKLCYFVYKIEDGHRCYTNIIWRIYNFQYTGKVVNTVLLYSYSSLRWTIK
jgi:hypothetical protein